MGMPSMPELIIFLLFIGVPIFISRFFSTKTKTTEDKESSKKLKKQLKPKIEKILNLNTNRETIVNKLKKLSLRHPFLQ